MIEHRLFFVNITKEEAWINRIIAQGCRPENFIPGRYKFQRLKTMISLPAHPEI